MAKKTKTFYHWSDPRNRASIQEHGLDSGRDRSGHGCVYLDLEFEPGDADWEHDIWAVSVKGLVLRRDDSLTGCWYEVTGSIPAARLTLVHQGSA
jgi:hypothetical protein